MAGVPTDGWSGGFTDSVLTKHGGWSGSFTDSVLPKWFVWSGRITDSVVFSKCDPGGLPGGGQRFSGVNSGGHESLVVVQHATLRQLAGGDVSPHHVALGRLRRAGANGGSF